MGLGNKEDELQLEDILPSHMALFKTLNHWALFLHLERLTPSLQVD